MLDVLWSLVPSPILSTDLNFQLNAPLYPLIPILLPPYKLASLQAQAAMISQNILPLLHVEILVPLLVPQLFHEVHHGEAMHSDQTTRLPGEFAV